MYNIIKSSFSTDKLEITRNNVKLRNFKLNPTITRKTGKIKENIYYTALTLFIKSSEEHPFPVNITVQFKGIFEFRDIDNEENVSTFLKGEAVQIMFPYLRTITTNLSVAAMMPPIILPIIDTTKLFNKSTDSVLIN